LKLERAARANDATDTCKQISNLEELNAWRSSLAHIEAGRKKPAVAA
jgi:hypothetical protein